jgi:RimJ/RimL family protein N-acetyltransferase
LGSRRPGWGQDELTGTFAYSQDGRTKDGVRFQLRPATPADSEVIAANIRSVCAEQVYLYTDTFIMTDEWRQALNRPPDEEGGRLLIVAETNDEVVGHLRLFPEWYGPKGSHVGEVGLSIVHPWRERGIGTAMMVYATDWAKHARFRKLTASVIATNRRALDLFGKFDFSQEGCRVRQFNVLGQYVDETLLARFVGEKHQRITASTE